MGKLQIQGSLVVNSDSSSTSPISSTITINGTEQSDIAKAPGIGIHITNKAWGSLRLNPNNANWCFYNSDCSGYMPVKASNFIGNLDGNAATATKLATARTISLTGSITGSGSFDGSGNLSIATTTNHTHSYLPLSGGNLTGHLYLTKAVSNSSISNASQIVFGTSSDNHVAISSNTHAIIINPSTSSTTNQIILSLDSTSTFPNGVNYATSAGSASSVSWSGITGKPTLFAVYDRGAIGSSYDIDTMTINGLFEIRSSSEVTISGTGAPANGWYPCLSMYGSNCRMQIAGGNRYGFWIRGVQGLDPTLSGQSWFKIQLTAGYGSTLPGSGYQTGTVFYKT